MFHHFHDTSKHPPVQGSISSDELMAILENLGPERILPAEEWMQRTISGTLREENLCLTFDDSLLCQYDVARPVLKAYGLTGFFFLYTSVLEGQVECLEVYRRFRTTYFKSMDEFYEAFYRMVKSCGYWPDVEKALTGLDCKDRRAKYPFYSEADLKFRTVRDAVLGPGRYREVMDGLIADTGIKVEELCKDLWMNDACVRDLHGEGHVIGLHSHTHPTRLQNLPLDVQRREYSANYEYLKNLLGASPTTMAHPSGSYSQDTLNLLQQLGIAIGFCNTMLVSGTSQLELPREDHANIKKALVHTSSTIIQ